MSMNKAVWALSRRERDEEERGRRKEWESHVGTDLGLTRQDKPKEE